MNVGDIVSAEDLASLPETTEIRSVPGGRWEIIAIPSAADTLAAELNNLGYVTPDALAAWILERFDRKSTPSLEEVSPNLAVIRDEDGDKWVRNAEGTYDCEGFSSPLYLNLPLDTLKLRYGPLTDADGVDIPRSSW